ncbi:MAG TPA: SDR family NAD(P)-dependent oxidoreductase [Thermaerobacter sp.]
MPEEGLSGQVWVITGGAGAIAGRIARAFAAAGARLVLADLDRAREALAARARELGAMSFTADLTQFAEAEALARRVREGMGRVDGLIHTVGTYAGGPVDAVDPAQYERLFDLNVRTLFYTVRAVLPLMLEQGEGFIAGFASGPAWRGAGPRAALYAAAKSAVATFLRSLDAELRERHREARPKAQVPPSVAEAGQGGREIPPVARAKSPGEGANAHENGATPQAGATNGTAGTSPPPAARSGGGIRVAVVYPMGIVDTPANRRSLPNADPDGWIDPDEIATVLLFAATRGPRGRLLELPVYPGR